MKIEVLSESLYSPERTFDVMKLRGKKVITSKGLVMGKVKKVIVGRKSFNIEGIIIGKVKEVMRKGDSNDFESLIVKSFWKKSFTVKSGEIKFLGKSIVLK